MRQCYVYALSHRAARQRGGGKARNLQFLLRHHFPVPTGWVVTWDAQKDYQLQGDAVLAQLKKDLSDKISPEKAYAVRSSASVEDENCHACAGLFQSILQVRGLDAVLDNIRLVWKSLASAEYLAYRQKNQTSENPVRMAVIVQEMVPAIFSGVVFSKNPLTGLSEIIIEVGCGNGEDQIKARQSPERWISKWGNWLIRPEPGLISEETARDIVRQTAEIARCYRQPVDLEWAYDGISLFFLQVRPITQRDIPVFSNRIAREMLPGIIKPLVWSVNTRLINQTWVTILKRLTGQKFQQEELTGHYYYRAYFNMTVFGCVFERLGMPHEALELLLGLEQDGPDKPHMRPGAGILIRLPRLLAFSIAFLWSVIPFRLLLHRQKKQYEKLMLCIKPDAEPKVWLDLANQVFSLTKPVAYYNIIIPLQAMMYHRLLTSLLKKYGYDARLLELDGYKSASEQYSPQASLEKLKWLNATFIATQDPEIAAKLEQGIAGFLERFGHFSDSGNDCSHIPWRETPDMIRQMIAQPARATDNREQRLTFADLKLPWHRLPFIRMVFCRASRFAVHREAISSLYTFGYGQFRTCFIQLGITLATQGVLENTEDIFYLYWQELVDLVNNPVKANQHKKINRRKLDIARYRDAVLPELIFGLEQPPVQTAAANALRGIPTSLGTYTGPARILQGLADFGRLNSGDVLVIPYSDVGWTPLFARAGAVVAEAGGILSHSSIIAREYRIPAVVSVSGACRIADGTIVTVNGFSGDILIEQTDTA